MRPMIVSMPVVVKMPSDPILSRHVCVEEDSERVSPELPRAARSRAGAAASASWSSSSSGEIPMDARVLMSAREIHDYIREIRRKRECPGEG